MGGHRHVRRASSSALVLSRFLPFFGELNRDQLEPTRGARSTCTLMVGLGVIDDTRGTTAIVEVRRAGLHRGRGGAPRRAAGRTCWFARARRVRALGRPPGHRDDRLGGLRPERGEPGRRARRAGGGHGRDRGRLLLRLRRAESRRASGPRRRRRCSRRSPPGICIGFLPWNFHPAKIFMGDAGSMLLGMLLAIATIEGIGKNLTAPSGGRHRGDRPARSPCRCSSC